jgi:type II secretory pathway pseudopilin PulG
LTNPSVVRTIAGVRRSGRQEGFTFVELSLTIITVTVLAAVVVLSISGMTTKGETAACARTRDAALTAIEIHRTDSETPTLPPTSFRVLFEHGHLELAEGVRLDRTGHVLIADGWSLAFTPSTPPTLTCRVTTT